MKRTILNSVVCFLLAAPVLSRGQDTNASVAAPVTPLPPPPVVAAVPAPAEISAVTNAAPAKPKKLRTTLSVTGKVLNVDTNAMTLTVGKHTYDLTSETRISKGGKPAIPPNSGGGQPSPLRANNGRHLHQQTSISRVQVCARSPYRQSSAAWSGPVESTSSNRFGARPALEQAPSSRHLHGQRKGTVHPAYPRRPASVSCVAKRPHAYPS